MTIEETIIFKINRGATRKDIGDIYPIGSERPKNIDWEFINMIIMTRWSLSGLKYIKRVSWDKLVEKGPVRVEVKG